MGVLVLALGLVFCLEGLVVALAPSRIVEIVATLARLPVEARRLIGLLAASLGVAMIAVARAIGV